MIEILVLVLMAAALTALADRGIRRSRCAQSTFWWVARLVCLFIPIFLLVSYGAFRLSKARSFQLMGEMVRRVETSSPFVALTFDDGPLPGYTDEIVRILEEKEAPGTFYLIGAEIENHPEEARKLVEAGHEIGNHSYTHPRMIAINYGTVRDEIERTDARIREIGYTGDIHFRPPYCKRFLVLPYYLWQTGRTSIICDIEPESYSEIATDRDAIVEHVMERVKPGSIILLHVMSSHRRATLEAVPLLIDRIRAEGLEFSTVSGLMAAAEPG